jgi:hypothetical protein
MAERIRIALQDGVKQEKVSVLAYRFEWEMERVIQRTDDHPREVIWATPGRKTFVHWVEDFLVQQRYLVVQGDDAEAVAEQLRSKLKTLSPVDVAKRLAGTRDEGDLIDVLYKAGVAAGPEEDSALREVFDAGFRHESPDVRRAAVFAAGYAEWPGLREPLERLAGSDPDLVVREDAAAMLEGLEQVWGGGTH